MEGLALWNLDSDVQELTALSPLLHYVNCGLPLIRSVCGGEVLDVVRPQTFLCVINTCGPRVFLGPLKISCCPIAHAAQASAAPWDSTQHHGPLARTRFGLLSA